MNTDEEKRAIVINEATRDWYESQEFPKKRFGGFATRKPVETEELALSIPGSINVRVPQQSPVGAAGLDYPRCAAI